MSIAAATQAPVSPDTLWRMYREGHSAECVMQQIPVGLQAQFLIDGRTLVSYQFNSHSQLLHWAIEKCADLSTRGWLPGDLGMTQDPMQQYVSAESAGITLRSCA